MSGLVKVVGVRFKRAGKVYYFDPGEFELAKGQTVIVETARGIEFGEAVGPAKEVAEAELTTPLKRVIRIATAADEAQLAENEAREKEAFGVAERKIAEHGLEMDLVDVEYTFDGNKIIFYFTAEGRVDFRELVRDLAAVFRTRIELRQIGVRDEAKMLGGIGPCGRALCCTTFLGDFAPVSIKMAKEQNLSLNPTKISGLCGRLLCCLRYESEHYERAKAAFPPIGTPVTTRDGDGKVAAVNVIKGMISVEFPTGVTHDYPADSVRAHGKAVAAQRTEPTADAAEPAPDGEPADEPPLEAGVGGDVGDSADPAAAASAAPNAGKCTGCSGCGGEGECPRAAAEAELKEDAVLVAEGDSAEEGPPAATVYPPPPAGPRPHGGPRPVEGPRPANGPRQPGAPGQSERPPAAGEGQPNGSRRRGNRRRGNRSRSNNRPQGTASMPQPRPRRDEPDGGVSGGGRQPSQ